MSTFSGNETCQTLFGKKMLPLYFTLAGNPENPGSALTGDCGNVLWQQLWQLVGAKQ
jgi:hypothetical protein